jgi:hypothetical protein
MNKRRQGLSRREYGRHAGISAAYVSKMVGDGKISLLPDGSIDARAADAQRAQRTIVGRGQRRIQMRQGSPTGGRNSFPVCTGCGEGYGLIDARACGSPDPERFCSKECVRDVSDGLSVAQIRRKIKSESCA